MLGRTDGTSPEVAAVMLASRGPRLCLSFGSTTTVICMGSSVANPAARAPVTSTLEGVGGTRSFSAST